MGDNNKTVNITFKGTKDPSLEKVGNDIGKMTAGAVTGPTARKSKEQKTKEAKQQKLELTGLRNKHSLALKELETQKKITKEYEKQNKQLKASLDGGGNDGKGGKGNKGGKGGKPKKDEEESSSSFIKKGLMAYGVSKAIGTAFGAIRSSIQDGYAAYQEKEQAVGDLSRTPFGRADLDKINEQTGNLGYKQAETAQQALQAALATGDIQDTVTAQRLSRAGMGMDVAGSTDLLGTMRRSGDKSVKSRSGQVDKLAAKGLASGIEATRMPEYLKGIQGLMEKGASMSTGDIGSESVSTLLTLLGKSGKSGLQGERGAGVLDKVDSMMRNPGGPDQEMFMMRAMGFGPGGDADFMSARKRMQAGITGKGGVQNVVDMVDEATKEFGSGEFRTYGLEKLSGGSLNAEQAEGFAAQVDKLRNTTDVGEKKKIEAEMAKQLEDMKPIEEKVNESNIQVAQHLKDVNDSLIKWGEALAPSIESMQKTLQDLIITALPLVTTVMKEVAAALKGLSALIKDPTGTVTATVADDIDKHKDDSPLGAAKHDMMHFGQDVAHIFKDEDPEEKQRQYLTAHDIKSRARALRLKKEGEQQPVVAPTVPEATASSENYSSPDQVMSSVTEAVMPVVKELASNIDKVNRGAVAHSARSGANGIAPTGPSGAFDQQSH